MRHDFAAASCTSWLYVSGFMLLLGAEINSTIERASTHQATTVQESHDGD
ncbi:MAG: hypothetical protein ACLQMO_00085 [Acidobacteriaceae bacterium]